MLRFIVWIALKKQMSFYTVFSPYNHLAFTQGSNGEKKRQKLDIKDRKNIYNYTNGVKEMFIIMYVQFMCRIVGCAAGS